MLILEIQQTTFKADDKFPSLQSVKTVLIKSLLEHLSLFYIFSNILACNLYATNPARFALIPVCPSRFALIPVCPESFRPNSHSARVVSPLFLYIVTRGIIFSLSQAEFILPFEL